MPVNSQPGEVKSARSDHVVVEPQSADNSYSYCSTQRIAIGPNLSRGDVQAWFEQNITLFTNNLASILGLDQGQQCITVLLLQGVER